MLKHPFKVTAATGFRVSHSPLEKLTGLRVKLDGSF